MNPEEMLQYLRDTGRIRSFNAQAQPLTGGVSSLIYLINDDGTAFVVKQALSKLRVKDEWFADPRRNEIERAYLDYANTIAPGSVPRVLFHDATAGLFAMEYLACPTWKSELLKGQARPAMAQRAGTLLGIVHRSSWGNPVLRESFSTLDNFYALRIEPYLLTAGRRNPGLEPFLSAEAKRLAGSALALVHGDFSPKNMLVGENQLVLLDCEAAWFGDPAFDAAFLLNHLFLKSMHLPPCCDNFLGVAEVFWLEYERELGSYFTHDFEHRVIRLLLMLMLARVDGKSPVEYLIDPAQKDLIRNFVALRLPLEGLGLRECAAQWRAQLRNPSL